MSLPPSTDQVVTPRAILFDMDGTLTEPVLDFERIRAEMGIEGPILEALCAMDEAQRREATVVLNRHEREAAEVCALNEGCLELLEAVDQMGLPAGLITRNSRASADLVCERHGLRFDVVLSREDEPHKPDPTPILRACGVLGVKAGASWMVGDGVHDIEAGHAAGAYTIWLSLGRDRPFDLRPRREVHSLHDVLALLRSLPISG